jgi:hypothetical protein
MSTSFDRLLADIDRRLRRQQQAGRIAPPKVTASRRRGYSREELEQAMALADAYLLANGASHRRLAVPSRAPRRAERCASQRATSVTASRPSPPQTSSPSSTSSA